jgi:antitoxin component of RelBE/YafQ-DinJ toxin-antitoxin module
MARKPIVDRNTVLQLLKEGKTSQFIATQFGVSRQAIDLHRKEFIRTGLLPGAGTTPLPAATPKTTTPAITAKPVFDITSKDISFDQMIDLFIKAFAALKRIPGLETELEKYRREHEDLLKQIEQLEELEKKRKEQETRWLQARNTDNLKP